MDSRLLKACRLLMEVAAAQLAEAELEGSFSEDDAVAARSEDRIHRDDRDQPPTARGDNPNFDPVRFRELKRGAVSQASEAISELAATETGAPEDVTSSLEGFRPPFAAPPTFVRSSESAERSGVEAGVRRVNQAVESDRPPSSITMRDISDHFERDARRY